MEDQISIYHVHYYVSTYLTEKVWINKKVLLRECKRHTARRVVNTPSVVLIGYPPLLTWLGGYPTWVPPSQGTPLAGYPPHQGTPSWQGTARPGYPPSGYPPCLDLAGYPLQLPRGILGNVAKHYGIWVPPRGQTDRHVSKHYLPVILRTRAVINCS